MSDKDLDHRPPASGPTPTPMNGSTGVSAANHPEVTLNITTKSQVRLNAERDPLYRPYCMRCPGLVRMATIVERFYWRCACGAEHDERGSPAAPTPLVAATEDHPAIYRDGHRLTATPPLPPTSSLGAATATATRKHDVSYFVQALADAAEVVGTKNGLDTKLLATAHLLNHFAERLRAIDGGSPTGEPGEEQPHEQVHEEKTAKALPAVANQLESISARDALSRWLPAAYLAGPFTPTGIGGNDGIVRDATGDFVCDTRGYEARADVIAAALNLIITERKP